MDQCKTKPECACVAQKINLDEPRYDQETYTGRAKHFFLTTNPLNLFVTNTRLEEAKCLIQKYKCGQKIPDDITEDQLWRAKTLYDSAYHPDTGEKMNLVGRMSAQVPMNMLITGGMITFYQSAPAVVFWQWLNQSFNALVNYTNRSGDIVQTDKPNFLVSIIYGIFPCCQRKEKRENKDSEWQILTSYVLATSGAVGTALGLNSLVKRFTWFQMIFVLERVAVMNLVLLLLKKMPPLVGRMVPFAAVAAANCINIPLMRAQELQHGTPVYDVNGNKLGYSKVAAQHGIGQVILSRIAMALPGMVLTPVVMDYLEKRGTLCRYPWLALPASVGILGLCLTFATPLACAFFRQKASLPFTHLEEELQVEIKKKYDVTDKERVYYNKGL